MRYVIELAAAFLGSFSFALVFHVRRERLLPASLGGLLAWTVYLLAGLAVETNVGRYFAAAVVVTIYAEIMARVVKCPATIFLSTGLVPLVPGGALYRSMYALMSRDFEAGSDYGVEALLLAAAIAMGMLFPTSVFHLLRRRREH